MSAINFCFKDNKETDEFGSNINQNLREWYNKKQIGNAYQSDMFHLY